MATSVSQCTYRCVVLPDKREVEATRAADGLNAPTGAWCSLTPGDSGGGLGILRLNAPTGAWCSLTPAAAKPSSLRIRSQCTYRCVVLPDTSTSGTTRPSIRVSMHLQVRGAP